MTVASRVVSLTEPELVKQCHLHNYKEWGHWLTTDQYLAREQGIRKFVESYGMKITYWALEVHDEVTGNWNIVSACESIARPSLIKYKGKPIRESISHSIGAVFTPKENRGKGYAKLLLSGVTDNLSKGWEIPEGVPSDDTLVALWSDIGSYYDQFGFRKTDTHEVEIKLDESVKVEWPAGLQKLGMGDLAACGNEEEKCMSDYIERETEKDGITRYVLPTRPGVMELLAWRAQYQGPYVTGRHPGPQVFGAATQDSWLVWHQDFGSKTQYILRSHSRAGPEKAMKDLTILLRAAITDAQEWQLTKLSFWAGDIPFDVTLDEVRDAYNASPVAGTQAVTIDRAKASWPMNLVTGKRSDIKWEVDGKYAWF